MSACPEMEGLLAERASGEIAAEDAARLEAHLETCGGCRDELHAYEETFSMARLPAADVRVADLDVRTFTAFQRRRRRRVTGLTLGAGFVAAVVAAGVVLAPALLTLRSLPPRQVAAVTEGTYAYADGAAPATAQAGSDTAASSTSGSTTELQPEDVALAALDEVDSY